ncbi:MAG: hypothetical protein PHE47_01740 [Oscillospiraceae bacterium]|nr:hypothetical protein [Oscillospiraceae bacterium]
MERCKGVGCWGGTVLGWTLANWQQGDLSIFRFGWTVLGCGIGALFGALLIFLGKWIAEEIKAKKD